MQVYSDPRRETNPTALPDCEVFHLTQQDFMAGTIPAGLCCDLANAMKSGSGMFTEAAALAGWYWWSCFPGCMPDSDPNGPHETEQAAIASAQQIGGAS